MKKIIINWELSLACNLNCSFCSQQERRKKNSSIPKKEEILTIIENLPKNCHISFLWWETLLIPYIYEIFLQLEKKDITYEITTNGILLEKFIETFQKLPNLMQINISIDWYWIYHDNSRWKIGLYQSIINNLPKLTTIKPIHISTVITHNISIKNIVQLHLDLSNFHIAEQKLIFLMNFSRREIQASQNKIPELKISKPGNSSLENIIHYKRKFLKIYKILKALDKKIPINIEPISIFTQKNITCKQLTSQYRINENGNIIICEFIENHFWNLKSLNFEQAITNPEYIKLKKNILQNFPLDICKSCCKQCIKKQE